MSQFFLPYQMEQENHDNWLNIDHNPYRKMSYAQQPKRKFSVSATKPEPVNMHQAKVQKLMGGKVEIHHHNLTFDLLQETYHSSPKKPNAKPPRAPSIVKPNDTFKNIFIGKNRSKQLRSSSKSPSSGRSSFSPAEKVHFENCIKVSRYCYETY